MKYYYVKGQPIEGEINNIEDYKHYLPKSGFVVLYNASEYKKAKDAAKSIKKDELKLTKESNESTKKAKKTKKTKKDKKDKDDKYYYPIFKIELNSHDDDFKKFSVDLSTRKYSLVEIWLSKEQCIELQSPSISISKEKNPQPKNTKVDFKRQTESPKITTNPDQRSLLYRIFRLRPLAFLGTFLLYAIYILPDIVHDIGEVRMSAVNLSLFLSVQAGFVAAAGAIASTMWNVSSLLIHPILKGTKGLLNLVWSFTPTLNSMKGLFNFIWTFTKENIKGFVNKEKAPVIKLSNPVAGGDHHDDRDQLLKPQAIYLIQHQPDDENKDNTDTKQTQQRSLPTSPKPSPANGKHQQLS